MKKVVICGGHLTPALALIEQLKKEKDNDIFFFGRKYSTEGNKNLSAEFTTIDKLGLKFIPITAGRLQRKFTKYTIWALLKIPIGFVQSFIQLLRVRPLLVVSFGGYLSLPIVFSSWFLGIKCLTHEQSSVMGLANKINALFCKNVYLSWPQTLNAHDKNKYQVIGNLTRTSILDKTAKNPKIKKFLKTERSLIFVMGGNQGSHFLNQLIFKSLPKLPEYSIIHQVGTTNFKGDLDRAKKIKTHNYFAVDYADSDNIGAILSRADLIISRSGANTIWDLATLAKVAMLVPLPISAGGEQEANAKILEAAGSAIILSQKDLDHDNLVKKIEDILNQLPKFQKNAQAFAKSLPRNASQIMASEISKLID